MLGDGEKGFFENRVFDAFRGKEGDALAAQDRLVKSQLQAKVSLAKADNDELDKLYADPDEKGGTTGRIDFPGQGERDLADRKARKQLAHATKVIKKQAETIVEMQADMEEMREFCRRKFRQYDEVLEEGQGGISALGEMLTKLGGGVIGLINAGEEPVFPLGLQVGLFADMAGPFLGKSKSAQWLVQTVGTVGKIVAYYNPRIGISSLFTVQNRTQRKLADGASLVGASADIPTGAAPHTQF
jgi:hypothetical protein